jgi:hypothetical protein
MSMEGTKGGSPSGTMGMGQDSPSAGGKGLVPYSAGSDNTPAVPTNNFASHLPNKWPVWTVHVAVRQEELPHTIQVLAMRGDHTH